MRLARLDDKVAKVEAPYLGVYRCRDCGTLLKAELLHIVVSYPSQQGEQK